MCCNRSRPLWARADNLLAGVEQGKGNIGKLLKDEEFYDRLTAIETEGQKLLTDIRTSDGTLGKLIHDPSLYNDVDAPLKRIDAILAGMQAGQGTAGKLLNDRRSTTSCRRPSARSTAW